jgi:serine/threonine protein kinase
MNGSKSSSVAGAPAAGTAAPRPSETTNATAETDATGEPRATGEIVVPKAAERQSLASRVGDRGPEQLASPIPGLRTGLLIGGKYRLMCEIGKGGMGAVWAATHESLGLEVAVKFLRPQSATEERLAERFIAEARMAAAIKHRFVVDVFDFGTTEHGLPYMVLELLEGQELAERMNDGPPMQVKDAIRFIAQCMSGLDAVHRAGVVHRDLKPENIFLISDSDGLFPKLLDFGIAQTNAADQFGGSSTPELMSEAGREPTRRRRLTNAGVAVGTPSYMAPEQLRATGDLDARADVYAMGVILFELLTGRVPFEGESTAALLLDIMTHQPPRLADLRPELGLPLSDLLSRAMARDRNERFTSAAEMREALNRVIPGLPAATTVVQSKSASANIGQYTELLLQSAKDPFAETGISTSWWRGQRKWAWVALGTLVAAAALIAALSLGKRGAPPTPTQPPVLAQRTPIAAPPSPAVVVKEVARPMAVGPTAPSAAPARELPREAPVSAPTASVKHSPSHHADPAPKQSGISINSSRAPKSASSSPAPTPRRHDQAPKKLFRNLDF